MRFVKEEWGENRYGDDKVRQITRGAALSPAERSAGGTHARLRRDDARFNQGPTGCQPCRPCTGDDARPPRGVPDVPSGKVEEAGQSAAKKSLRVLRWALSMSLVSWAGNTRA